MNTMYTQHRLIVTKTGPAKLGFVKAIKDYTGFGLKEAKDIVDSWDVKYTQNYDFRQTPEHLESDGTLLLSLTPEKAITLRQTLEQLGVEFRLDGRELFRDKKLLSLGIIADDDMRNRGIYHDMEAIKKAVLDEDDDYLRTLVEDGFLGWGNLTEEEVKFEFKKRI